MGTGIIYAAIVAVWVAVLVPMWLRRHDEMTETRSVDRFSRAMHTLSRRDDPAGDRRYVVVPSRPADATTAVTSASRRTGHDTPDSPASHPASAGPVRPASAGPVYPASAGPVRPAPARPSTPDRRPDPRRRPAAVRRRQRMLARRRRVLAVLLTGSVLALGLAVAGVISAWAPILVAALLLGDLAALWAAARRRTGRSGRTPASRSAAEPRRGRAAAGARRPGRDESDAGSTSVLPVTHPGGVDARRSPGGSTPTAPLPRIDGDGTGIAARDGADDEDTDGEGAWQPLPVPLPTYVSKPRAPRTTRSIDFSSPDTWQAVRATTAQAGDPEQASTAGPATAAAGQATDGSADSDPAASSGAGTGPGTGSATPDVSLRGDGDDPLDRILERRRAVGD